MKVIWNKYWDWHLSLKEDQQYWANKLVGAVLGAVICLTITFCLR